MIPTRVHGLLDWLSAAALVTAPRLLGWRPGLRRALDGAALGTATYSLATRYEWGAADALSMEEHLALDALQGASFCAAAVLLDEEPREVRLALAAYGVFALAAAALTDRHPSGGTKYR